MSDERIDGAAPDPESELCLSCGLCCNSGLFTHVELSDEDRTLLAGHGLPAPERIDQPCSFWDRHCTIYNVRPHPCQKFRCELLARFRSGEVELSEALDRVATAKAMRARFIGELPDTRKLNDAAKEWRDQNPQHRSPRQMKAMLEYVAFRMFVERHFLPPHQHWAMSPPAEPADPPSCT